MESYIKYPRTPHLPWSLGASFDDKVLPSVSHFEGRQVIVTEKMDGENTTLYRDHIHARSLDSKGGEDRAWVKQFWASVRGEIPEGWRICGENLWACHSIPYSDLQSYFYGFSIWGSHNIALPWSDTLEYFSMLGIKPVPVLWGGKWNELAIRSLCDTLNPDQTEGYVVRLADSFHYDDFGRSVAKFVRANHVQTDKHWRSQQFVANGLAA
jgi:hypothetical protein